MTRPDEQHMESIYCIRCRYDLRSLPVAGNCPECGLPITISADWYEHARSNKEWLEILEAGQKWNHAGIKIMILLCCAIAFARYFLDLTSIYLLAIPLGLTLLMVLIGVFKCTAMPASMYLRHDVYFASMLVRFSIFAVLASIPAIFLFNGQFSPKTLQFVVTMVFSPFGFAGFIGGLSFGKFMKLVAESLKDEFSERRARIYTSGFAISWLIVAVSFSLLVTCNLDLLLYAYMPSIGAYLIFGALILYLPASIKASILRSLAEVPQIRGLEPAETDVTGTPGKLT